MSPLAITRGRFHRSLRMVQRAALTLVAAVALAACSSPKSVLTTTTTSTTTATGATSTSGVTTTEPTAPPCTPALLTVTATFAGATAGGSYYRFAATNNGPSACTLQGYPKLAFYGPSAGGGAGGGPTVPISAIDGGPPPGAVSIGHMASAEFLMLFTEVPVNGGGCSTVASVEVTLPGSSGADPVPLSFSPCGGTVTVYAFGPSGSETP